MINIETSRSRFPAPENHRFLLGAALEAFKDEIRDTGQTLPADSGRVMVTVFRNQGGDYLLGVQAPDLTVEGASISLSQPNSTIISLSPCDPPRELDAARAAELGQVWYLAQSAVAQGDTLLVVATNYYHTK